MKKLIVLIIISLFVPAVIAEQTVKNKNLPSGIFKKKHNGCYVQYDNNGKKLGVYKITKGKLVKVK